MVLVEYINANIYVLHGRVQGFLNAKIIAMISKVKLIKAIIARSKV